MVIETSIRIYICTARCGSAVDDSALLLEVFHLVPLGPECQSKPRDCGRRHPIGLPEALYLTVDGPSGEGKEQGQMGSLARRARSSGPGNY